MPAKYIIFLVVMLLAPTTVQTYLPLTGNTTGPTATPTPTETVIPTILGTPVSITTTPVSPLPTPTFWLCEGVEPPLPPECKSGTVPEQ